MRVNSKAVCAATLGVIGLSSLALADSGTWSAAPADGLWSNPANWANSVVPGSVGTTTNTDTATFAQSSVTAVTIDAGRNVQNVTLTGPGGATTYGYTLGTATGPALLLTSGGLLQATNLSGTGSSNVAAPLQIQGNAGTYTVQSDIPGTSRLLTVSGGVSGTSTAGSTTLVTFQGASGGTNLISGVISDGTAGGNVAVAKSGTGLWVVNSANATYTGGTTINGGVLRLSASGNTSGSLGTGTLGFTGGQLRLQSTGGATINNAVNVAAGSTGQISGRSTLVFNPSALTGTGTLNFLGDSGQTTGALTFANFAGVVDTTGQTNFRFNTNYNTTSLQNARLNVAAGTGVSTQYGTNTTLPTIDIGALSGAGSIGYSGIAGTGYITYRLGNRNEDSTFSGTIINGLSATALTKVGTATQTLTGANSYTGPTTITSGTLNINGINALGGGVYGNFNGNGVTFNGGTLQYATTLTSSADVTATAGGPAKNVTFAATAVVDTNGNTVTWANPAGNNGAGGLTKIGSGTLVLNGANAYTGTTTVKAGQLTIGTAAQGPLLTGAGGADVLGGRLVFDYTGGTSPVDAVKTALDSAYPTGFATGQIRSTTLTTGQTIGYGDNGSSVSVRVTLPGDANLDGQVDFNDFLVLQNNFGKTTTRFDQGNFNYDGATDFNDFLVLQNNFGKSIGSGGPAAVTAAEYARVMSITSASAVPEPTSLAVLALGAAGLLRRRRA